MNIGTFDQVFSGLRDMAKCLHGYKQELVKQGFSEAEAMRLTIAYQTSILIPKPDNKG